MESCRASICWSRRGESFTCTGPEPPPAAGPAPTPAAGTNSSGVSSPHAPARGAAAGARHADRAGHQDTRLQHRVSSSTVCWCTPRCPASHREHAALHTLLRRKRPKTSTAGQHHAPKLLSSPGTGHPSPTAQRHGAPPGLRPLQGPSLQCWAHSSLPPQQLHAPRSSWALSTPAARSPAPQPAWHPSVLAQELPSFPPPPWPDLALGHAWVPVGHLPAVPPCMHGRGWGALACWGAVLYLSAVPLRYKERRQRKDEKKQN